MTASRKKRAKEARRVQGRLQEMLDSETIVHFGEASLPASHTPNSDTQAAPLPVKWQLAKTQSIREAIIARPPQTLRLHLIRSEYTPYGSIMKKTARVAFPLILDLTRFTAKGVWEDVADRGVLAALKRGYTQARVLYRLESVICHYGYTTSSGHYIAIRRKPTGHDDRWRPELAYKMCPDGCQCENCAYFGQVRTREEPGRGWLRISDADVEEVGVEALVQVQGQAFMLFYERVGECQLPLKDEASSEANASQLATIANSPA